MSNEFCRRLRKIRLVNPETGERLSKKLLSRFSTVNRFSDWRGVRLVIELPFSERISRFAKDESGEKSTMPEFSEQFKARRFDRAESGDRAVMALPRNVRFVNCGRFCTNDKLVTPLPLR